MKNVVFLVFYLLFPITGLLAQSESELNTKAWEIAKSAPDSAIILANSVLKTTKNTDEKASAYNTLGVAYRVKGEYNIAIEKFLLALKLHEQLNSKSKVATTLNNIGVTNMYNEVYDVAIDYYSKSLVIFQEINDTSGLALVTNNLGIVYSYQEKFDEALKFFLESLDIEKKRKNNKGIAESLNNIGAVYYYKGDLKNALLYFEKSLIIEIEFGKSTGLVASYSNLGQIYTETQQYPKAETNLRKAIALAKELDAKSELLDAYSNFSAMFELMVKSDSSLKYYKEYAQLDKSIRNIEKSEQIADMQEKYQSVQKDSKIRIQKLNLEKSEAQIKFQRYQILALFALIILILVLAWALYRYTKYKQEQRMQLELLSEKERGLRALLDATETERQRIAKDLHDGIGQQLAGVKLALESISGDENIKKISTIIDESASELRTISHQMMPKVLKEFGLIPALEDMFEKSFANTKISYEFDKLGDNARLGEKEEIHLFRICQELVNNIIKHSKATKISIMVSKTKTSFSINMTDNGIGFDFEKNSKGIGFSNINTRLSTINGKISIHSDQQTGTEIIVRLPLE